MLNLAAVTIENATELDQPPEHLHEVAVELQATEEVIGRAWLALHRIARGALSREATARLE
jgi:hypothetical protein